LAANLLNPERGSGAIFFPLNMEKSFQTRITVLLLAFFTVAAAVFASLNFSQENTFQVPTDGVNWIEAHGALEAQRVLDGGPGQRAGIKAGDLLIAANEIPVVRGGSLARQLYKTKSYGTVKYTLRRDGVEISGVPVILDPQDRSINQGFRLIALVYLGIGLYVLLRRWTAPHSTHFYIFCLASFVFYSFQYTTKFNNFDWIVYWGYIAAGALQPALFLHFALAFPEEKRGVPKWLLAITYFPVVLVVGLQVIAQRLWSATEVLQHRLDQLALGYLALYYVLAALILYVNYRRSRIPLRRQQLKWLTRGTMIAIVPFTLLYALPFVAGLQTPSLLAKLGCISLVVLPLTFSWAIVRYRLMDVDLIFKRGVTYTLATATLVGLYFAIVAIAADIVRTRLPSFGTWGLIAAIILTAQLFSSRSGR